MKNRCYICGCKNNLTLVKNKYIKTTGFNVPIKKGYICDKHKNMIIKEKK